MRLRILARPVGNIDELVLDQFRVGGVYDVGTQLGCVFLAEGWAEPVPDDDPFVLVRPSPSGADLQPLVLVVEDDPEISHLTESLLVSHGYRVMLAAHGRDAIQRLTEQCPDIIVLDLNMPVMNGWQFRTEQRYLTDRKRAAVPVLLMTAEDEAAAQAETLRVFGVIKKPFDPDDLLDAVSAAIGSQVSAPDGIRSIRPWQKRRASAR